MSHLSNSWFGLQRDVTLLQSVTSSGYTVMDKGGSNLCGGAGFRKVYLSTLWHTKKKVQFTFFLTEEPFAKNLHMAHWKPMCLKTWQSCSKINTPYRGIQPWTVHDRPCKVTPLVPSQIISTFENGITRTASKACLLCWTRSVFTLPKRQHLIFRTHDSQMPEEKYSV